MKKEWITLLDQWEFKRVKCFNAQLILSPNILKIKYIGESLAKWSLNVQLNNKYIFRLNMFSIKPHVWKLLKLKGCSLLFNYRNEYQNNHFPKNMVWILYSYGKEFVYI